MARFGIVGGAASYVAAELVGKVTLAARLPRALADEGIRPSLQALVPWQEISRAAIGACSPRSPASRSSAQAHVRGCGGGRDRALPARALGLACALGAGIYLAVLWATGVRPASVLGALRSRRPEGAP